MRPRAMTYLLPGLSVLGLVFAVGFIVLAGRTEPPTPPLVTPPRAPFPETIAGAGIIEPSGERTISVGPTLPGVVAEVDARVGALVTSGTPLFRIDDRALQAERGVRRAALDSARARLARLEALPRPEEVPPAKARVEQMEAAYSDLSRQRDRLEKAYAAGQGVVSLDEIDQRRFRTTVAEKALAQARAELALIEAGAWQPDVIQARAEVVQAEAALHQTEVDIERSTVRAPVDGTVLQVNVREGIYAQPNSDLVLLGDTRTLHVRVDVDEESAPLVRPGGHARCTLKGLPGVEIPLAFVRIEPFIQPKKSLTGDNTERVDTRVLQVIFKLGPTPLTVYVGQQVDVFMEGTLRDKVTR